MAEKKESVSLVKVLPFIEKLQPLVSEMRTIVESMPECTRKKYLLTSVVGIEKKVNVTQAKKELSEEQVTAYIGTHPEILAKFAASDAGAKEVAMSATTDEEKEAAHKSGSSKQKKSRF
jgi:septum formation inhibitor MinC